MIDCNHAASADKAYRSIAFPRASLDLELDLFSWSNRFLKSILQSVFWSQFIFNMAAHFSHVWDFAKSLTALNYDLIAAIA